MSTTEDRLVIDLELRAKKLADTQAQLKSIAESLKNTANFVKEAGKGFTKFDGQISASVTALRKFDRNMKEFGKGDAIVRLNQTMLALQKNISKSAEAMQVLRYSEKRQTIGNASVIDQQVQGQALRVGQEKYNLELDRSNKTVKARLQMEEAVLQRLKDQQAVLKQNANTQKQIDSLNAKANSPALLKAQSNLRVASATADSGAGLFKIQAALLVNYTLMNSLFQLFSFGSQYVVQLGESFADLQAITASTNVEMSDLEKTIIDVSKGTKFSAVEVANAAKTLAQAGFSAREINESIQGVVLLATATGTDLATSVDVASSAISVFELRAEDMNRVANVLTGALNETKLTMDKVALGIQYAGNIANEAGLSFEETVAVLGAMSNAGIRSGSTLGTGLRQVLIELMNPTDKLKNKLAEVGLTVTDVDVKSKGFVGVMKTLRDAGFTTADAFESLEVRSAAAFAAIENSPDTITELQRSFLFTSAAAKANAIQMDTLAASMKVFSNNLGLAIVQMSGPFVSTLKVVTNGISALLGGLQGMNVILPLVGTAILSFGTAWGIIKLASLTKELNLIGAAMKTMAAIGSATSFGEIFAALGAAGAGPVLALGLAIGVIATSIYALSGGFSDLKDELDGLQANVDKAKGEFENTENAINSVEKETTRLIDRMAELKDSPGELYNEFLSLENQFGSLGYEIENHTNPSIDDLIGSLDKLKDKLADVGAEQIKFLQNQRALSMMKQSEDIGNSGKAGFFSGLNRNFYYDTSNVQNSLSSITSKAQTDGNFDASKSSQAELQAKLRDIGEARTQLMDLGNSVADMIKEINKTGKKIGEKSTLEKQSKEINEALGKVNTYAANLSSFIVGTSVQVQKVFATTDLSKDINAKIEEYDKQLTDLRSQKPKTTEERVALEKQIKDLGAALDKAISELLFTKLGLTVDAMKKQGIEVTGPEIIALGAGAKTNVKSATEEGRSDIGKLTQKTKDDLDVKTEQAITSMEKFKQAFDKITNAFETASKKYDYIATESTDLERGGLAGKYSSTELDMFKDKQKSIDIQKMSAQINMLPQQISALNTQLGNKGSEANRLGNMPKTPDNLIASTKADREYNDLLSQRQALQNQLIDTQNAYNAAIGRETEAHISLGDQLNYVLEGYMKVAEIQSAWGYDLKENVTKVLDEARGAFKDFVTDTVTGTKSVGDAFKAMASRILQSMLDIATDKLSAQLMGGLTSLLGDAATSFFGGGGGTSVANPNIAGTSYMMYGGGLVRAAGGADIGRDNQLVLARKGEFVLRNSAVDMLGRDNLQALNANGNRRISAASANIQGAVSGAEGKAGGIEVVNVYVVSPDQKPGLSKNDVIATISDDMATGGQTKKLVKSIMAGQS